MKTVNWRDGEGYPDEVETMAEKWAWEFLRRSTAYRKDYGRLRKNRYDGGEEAFCDKYLLRLSLDPDQEPSGGRIFAPEVRSKYARRRGRIRIPPGHLVVVVDVSRVGSVPQTVKFIAKRLDKAVERRDIDERDAQQKPRIQAKRFRLLLRLLDAHASPNRPSKRKIAQRLFGGTGPRELKKLRMAEKKANEMVKRGYTKLAGLGKRTGEEANRKRLKRAGAD